VSEPNIVTSEGDEFAEYARVKTRESDKASNVEGVAVNL